MGFPDGLSLRSATPDDAEEVLELVNACERVDIGEPFLELSDVQNDWATPLIDISEDVLLVHDQDQLVAWAEVCEERADADVRPEHRGRGIGTALLDWTEQRALARVPPEKSVRLGQTIPEKLLDARALFERRGYEMLWDSWILRLPPDVDVPATAPVGVEIRQYRPDEEHEVYTVIDNAFSEWEGRESRSFEDWQSAVTHSVGFDPALLLVAEVDERVAGAAVGVHYPGEGWVDQVAVDPAHRGRGIARALIGSLFREFRGRGEQRMGLNTDSRTGALGLYTGMGMVVEQTFVRWSRVLR